MPLKARSKHQRYGQVGSPLADARVDLNASFRDTPTLFSL
jgi:hypothetical protein